MPDPQKSAFTHKFKQHPQQSHQICISIFARPQSHKIKLTVLSLYFGQNT